ncbi:MAG: crosslink repair DNA glycosylase YcaQ family protein [Aeromicrobium sp.]|uniref:winged helix-turn-helix domain-containing protein n=1 Tax=Aeromicrobium sp. TaxID=1871063 RepID=UPI003C404CC1
MTLTVTQARRIALAAQGFTRPRPGAHGRTVAAAHLNETISRLGFFQIDSVNVLARAHYMPLFSRKGAYDRDLLHRAAGRAPRRLFEYWAHVAALVDVQLWPAMQHRMASGHGMWGGMQRIGRDHPALVERVYRDVVERGPVTARQIEIDTERDRSSWGWNWSEAKVALEHLFYVGRITSARRNSQFEREYDLPERVIPADVLARPALDHDAAHVALVEHAARALGVGTAQCFNDYFRLAPEPGRHALEALLADGTLEPVSIAGWKRPAYRHRDSVLPRQVRARALLSPFDPLVFERTRTEKLFDFRYRIEIYVPEAKRVHGYYVLPFLLGDRLVARVDLKADRSERRLIVHGAWAESHAPDDTADHLADELHLMANWLGLDTVSAPTKGDLAAGLTSVLARR